MLCRMLVQPDNFDFHKKYIACDAKEGRDACLTAWAELVKRGYIKETRVTNERGQHVNWQYDIWECAQLPVNPDSDFQGVGESGFQGVGKTVVSQDIQPDSDNPDPANQLPENPETDFQGVGQGDPPRLPENPETEFQEPGKPDPDFQGVGLSPDGGPDSDNPDPVSQEADSRARDIRLTGKPDPGFPSLTINTTTTTQPSSCSSPEDSGDSYAARGVDLIRTDTDHDRAHRDALVADHGVELVGKAAHDLRRETGHAPYPSIVARSLEIKRPMPVDPRAERLVEKCKAILVRLRERENTTGKRVLPTGPVLGDLTVEASQRVPNQIGKLRRLHAYLSAITFALFEGPGLDQREALAIDSIRAALADQREPEAVAVAIVKKGLRRLAEENDRARALTHVVDDSIPSGDKLTTGAG